MLTRAVVIDSTADVAPGAATSECRVQRLQYLGVQASDLDAAQHRPDVCVEFLDVPGLRGRLQLHDLKPAVKALVQGADLVRRRSAAAVRRRPVASRWLAARLAAQ
jgi:hypothetical protein